MSEITNQSCCPQCGRPTTFTIKSQGIVLGSCETCEMPFVAGGGGTGERAEPSQERDKFQIAWAEYNPKGNAGGWERVAFTSGYGKGFKDGRPALAEGSRTRHCAICAENRPATCDGRCELVAPVREKRERRMADLNSVSIEAMERQAAAEKRVDEMYRRICQRNLNSMPNKTQRADNFRHLAIILAKQLNRLEAECAPEPEGTRICGNCGLELAETETEEQCRAIFGNLTAEQKAECVAESPSSASEQENK